MTNGSDGTATMTTSMDLNRGQDGTVKFTRSLSKEVVQVASRKNLPQGHSQYPTIGHVMRYDEW